MTERRFHLTMTLVLGSAFAGLGCTPATVSQSPDNGAAADDSATAGHENPQPASSSALNNVARTMAAQTETTTSVASGTPISIHPNVVPETSWYDLMNHITPPAPGGAGGGSSGGGNPGGPANRPGQFAAQLDANVFDELIGWPHSQITHGDTVNVTVSVSDGNVLDYTVPGFCLNHDVQAAVAAMGEVSQASGTMDLDVTPNQFSLVMTTSAIDIGDGSFSLTANLVLQGRGGSMSLDGTGTHTVTVSWNGNQMQYASFTEYWVDMGASAPGQPNVLIQAHQTFSLNGTLTD